MDMTDITSRCLNPAPGGPGTEPKWTGSAKDAVGTAYSTASRIWFTFLGGVINEVYYPTIDRPQIGHPTSFDAVGELSARGFVLPKCGCPPLLFTLGLYL